MHRLEETNSAGEKTQDVDAGGEKWLISTCADLLTLQTYAIGTGAVGARREHSFTFIKVQVPAVSLFVAAAIVSCPPM